MEIPISIPRATDVADGVPNTRDILDEICAPAHQMELRTASGSAASLRGPHPCQGCGRRSRWA
jgi:hypothetical protein